MKDRKLKARFTSIIGIVLIALSLILNVWLLELIFEPADGFELLSQTLIWTAQIILLLLGVIFFRMKNRFSFSKGLLINLSLLLVTLAFFFGAAEAALRILGRKPWKVNPNNITVEPGGKLFLQHPTLGYAQRPGKYKITLSTGYTFTASHDATGYRITHPSAEVAGKNKEEIWILGDSMNYGWSLNDDEVYPWYLQESIPEYEIINFGVNGYGTLHSYIQFKEGLKSGRKPKIVILNYGSFHDRRNTLLRERRKLIAGPWNSIGLTAQPYARFNGKGKLEYKFSETCYMEFPFMRSSALMHFIELIFNHLEEKVHKSHKVTEAIILDFAKLAKHNNVVFVVAGIWWDPLTKETLEFCKSKGILAVDISIDLDQPGKRNYPHDDHPVPEVHKEYSKMLEAFLHEKELL